jgi:AcrR family transcriptional regulator
VAPDQPDGDRRVRRTQRALKEAFLELVLERGYDKVSIEDITERADVARATFYAHFQNKESLLASVFTELLDDVAPRVMGTGTPSAALAVAPIEEAYRHADGLKDIYRVCLSGAAEGLAQDAYLETVYGLSQRTIEARVRALGTTPNVPVEVIARAFAGAHLALLRAWLAGKLDYSAKEMVSMQVEVLNRGMAWGQGVPREDLSLA